MQWTIFKRELIFSTDDCGIRKQVSGNLLHLVLICARITCELISLGLLFSYPLRRKVGSPHFSLYQVRSVIGSKWHHEK